MKRYCLVLVMLFMIVLMSSPRLCHADVSIADLGPSQVMLFSRELFVSRPNPDGTRPPLSRYIIRGVVWSPASMNTNTSKTDPNNANVRRSEFGIWASTDLPLIRQMNANTVIVPLGFPLDSSGIAILDQLYANGLMVIMTVDDAINDLTRVQQSVNLFKSHPSVLFWMIGNEWNINKYYGVASSVEDAAQRTQAAAALIKTLDPNHPVATSYGDIDINASGLRLDDTRRYVNTVCPDVNVWSLNIYRSNTFGSLFSQWDNLSTGKPIMIGEFGTDAFKTTNYPPLTCTLNGGIDEAAQASWLLGLWNDLFRNLSALNPNKYTLGGAVFEFCDEWWKVVPSGSQQNCGHDQNPGGHPDAVANEEYFGLVDITRRPRQAYYAMKTAYDPFYQPPQQVASAISLRAVSASTNRGGAIFNVDGKFIYNRGGGAGGGRGFNVAVLNPCTGELTGPIRNFDTWGYRGIGTAMNEMVSYLTSIPDGLIVMIAIGDEGGLNPDASCSSFNNSWTQNGLQTLEALGSQQIMQYCFWGAWAMITVKESTQPLRGRLIKEGINNSVGTSSSYAAVSIEAGFNLPVLNPTSQLFPASGGSSQLSITSTACRFTITSNSNWVTVNGSNMGNGSGIINYFVAPNDSTSAREAILSVADGRMIRVTQAGRLGVVACVSAGSYLPEVAPDSIVAAFGSSLATQTQIAQSLPLPTTLAGSSVFVGDSTGVQRSAPLFLVSPTQINYLMPTGTAAGSAIVSVVSGNTTVVGEVQVAAVAPSIFSANADGKGLVAAVALRVRPDGTQIIEPVVRFDPVQGRNVAIPIDLSVPGDLVYLLLYGTSWRHRSSLVAVNATIGGISSEVNFAGAQGDYAGLDQCNIKIPQQLSGRGEVDVVLMVDGKASNTVKITIK